MIKDLMAYQVFIFAFSGIRRTHVKADWQKIRKMVVYAKNRGFFFGIIVIFVSLHTNLYINHGKEFHLAG